MDELTAATNLIKRLQMENASLDHKVFNLEFEVEGLLTGTLQDKKTIKHLQLGLAAASETIKMLEEIKATQAKSIKELQGYLSERSRY